MEGCARLAKDGKIMMGLTRIHFPARLLVRMCDMASQKDAKRHQVSRRKQYEAVCQ